MENKKGFNTPVHGIHFIKKSEGPKRPFDESYEIWREALIGEDRHSVKSQLIQLGWKIAFYNSIKNHSTLCNKTSKKGFLFSHALEALIKINFFEAASIGLRRALLDGSKIDCKKTAVYSLKSVIIDVANHHPTIKRKKLLEKLKIFINQNKNIDPEYAEEDFNKIFDSVSGATNDNRKPNDKINPKIMENLTKILSNHEKFEFKVNKYYAHAANPNNRKFKNPSIDNLETDIQNHDIKLDDINNLFYDGCRIFTFFTRLFFYYETIFFTPYSEFYFKNLEKPFINKKNLHLIGFNYEDFTEKFSVDRFSTVDLLATGFPHDHPAR